MTREALVLIANGSRPRFDELLDWAHYDDRDVLKYLHESHNEYGGGHHGLKKEELIRRCRELDLPVPWPESETFGNQHEKRGRAGG